MNEGTNGTTVNRGPTPKIKISFLFPVAGLTFKGVLYLLRAGAGLIGVAVSLGWLSPNVLGLTLPAEKGVAYFAGLAALRILVALLFFLAAFEIATLGHGWGFNLGIALFGIELIRTLAGLAGGQRQPLILADFLLSLLVLVWLLLIAPRKHKF